MSLEANSNKCRTCMGQCQTYHQLYDYVDENYKILEMLDQIVPQIHIKTNDVFSHLVCQPCVEKLLASYKFQTLCIETDSRLHQMLGESCLNGEQVDQEACLDSSLDPLKGDDNFKLKQEKLESEKFECEINPHDLEVHIKTDDEFQDHRDGNSDQKADSTESDTDSSNEKLSVLKARKLQQRSHKKGSKKNCKKIDILCKECGKIFDSYYHLKRHAEVHSKKQAFSCDICKYSFAAEKTFKVHMQIHESNSTSICFKCSYCDKSFEKRAALGQHKKAHHKCNKNKSQENEEQKDEDHEYKDFNEEEIKAEKSDDMDENSLVNSKVLGKLEVDIEERQPSNSTQSEEMNMPLQTWAENKNDSEDNEEWLNNEDDSEYMDDDDDDFDEDDANENDPNDDFVDTGIGEIEKPNTRNRRNGNYPCQVCGKIFDRPYRLKRHSSVHSHERPYACEVCKYRFGTSNLLKIHMLQHETETGDNASGSARPDGFKCPDCPRRFEKQASLSAHRQIHTRNTSEANYPCTACQRTFMTVRSLTDHITNKHPEMEKHKCDQCDKTFVLHAHLIEHLNRHKGNKNLVCLICEKEFGYTNTLKEHMRTHSGECPYLCPQCGKTFRSASNLRQHMERHFGLKKYQCPECPSRFNCRSDLIKHTSTHSNAKPHVCDTCGSRFTRAYSLQKHKLLHSGERPFKCDQCNMTFAIVYHLRRHMRTHTGEKPYKCKFCDRAYAESGDLTKHLRTHVGKNTYMCDQCPMAFKYQSDLRKHVSEHYKMSQKSTLPGQKLGEEMEQLEHNDNEMSIMDISHEAAASTAVVMDLVGSC